MVLVQTFWWTLGPGGFGPDPFGGGFMDPYGSGDPFMQEQAYFFDDPALYDDYIFLEEEGGGFEPLNTTDYTKGTNANDTFRCRHLMTLIH